MQIGNLYAAAEHGAPPDVPLPAPLPPRRRSLGGKAKAAAKHAAGSPLSAVRAVLSGKNLLANIMSSTKGGRVTCNWGNPEYGAAELEPLLECTTLVDIRWLARFAAQEGDDLKPIPSWQALPPEAEVQKAQLEAYMGIGLPVLVLSYPWLDRRHPDPQRHHLKMLRPLLDAIVASSVPLLLIGPGIGCAANNVSRLGGTPQCVEFVAAFLAELGVSRDRFIRLEGGATAWVDAGHDFERPGVDTTALCSLHAAIVAAGLDAGSASSTGLLGSASLGSIERLLKADGGRAQLLELFKAAGFALKERQKLANFLAKAHRDGRLVVAPEAAAPPEPEPAQAAPANVTDAGALAPAPAPPVASEAHQAQASA